MASESIGDRGFEVTKVRIGVARDDHRSFATPDTAARLNCGSVAPAAAVVNSTDEYLPMKFIAGNRTLCRDNLAQRSDLMEAVRRTHKRFGLDRFRGAPQAAAGVLHQFQAVERRKAIAAVGRRGCDPHRPGIDASSPPRGRSCVELVMISGAASLERLT
jgi:hypothetical protein